MTVVGFFAIVVALSFVLGGIQTTWLTRQAIRAIGNRQRHMPIMVWFISICSIVLLTLMGTLIIWGTWFCHNPVDIQSYHNNVGVWGLFMTIRFSGYLALIGMGLYDPLNAFCLWLEGVTKLLAKLLPPILHLKKR